MSDPFSHPSSTKLLGDIKNILNSKDIFQRLDRHLIFVCGGPMSKDPPTMRDQFIQYSFKELQQFRVFLVESATQDLTQYNKPEFFNIADIETLVADISDCIILFPESVGSVAEVGYFANSTKIIKKLMVVNDVKYQNDSFLNIGILDKINSYSLFKPVILANFDQPD